MSFARSLPALGVLLTAAAVQAAPVPITFTRINGNNIENPAAQFLAVADEGAAGTVTFTFTNTAVTPSNIANIYFDDNNDLLGFNAITTQTGTNFAAGSNPANLPGGNSISPQFTADSDLSVSAVAGPPANGINAAGDVLTVTYNLLGGATFADVTSALSSGALRLGLHVRSIGTEGGSDSFVSLIPLPSTAALGVVGLVGLATRRRRL